MAWIRYTDELASNSPPLKRPKGGEDSLEMLERLGLNNFPDEVIEAAGFKGYEPGELFYSCLAQTWKGHPKHARVIAGGFTFAVEMPNLSPAAMLGRLGGLKGGKVKSERKTLANRENAKRPRPRSP